MASKESSMRLLVDYSQHFRDFNFLRRKLDKLTMLVKDLRLVSPWQGMPGYHMAEKWAFERWWVVERNHLPDKDYQDYNKVNEALVRQADFVVAFYVEGDEKVWDLIRRAKFYDVRIRIYDVEES